MMNRSIAVFGASSGYGLSITKRCLIEERNVVACSRNARSSVELNDLRTKYGDRLELRDLDVVDEAQVASFFKQLSASHSKLDDIYFTVGHPQDTSCRFPLTEIEKNDYFEMLEVNAFAAFSILRAALCAANPIKISAFVFLSSTAALSSKTGHGPYNTSKLLLNGLMLNLASELKLKGSTTKVFGLDPWEAKTRMNQGSDISPDHILPVIEAISECRSWLRTGLIFSPDGNSVKFPGSEVLNKNLFRIYKDICSKELNYIRESFRLSSTDAQKN